MMIFRRYLFFFEFFIFCFHVQRFEGSMFVDFGTLDSSVTLPLFFRNTKAHRGPCWVCLCIHSIRSSVFVLPSPSIWSHPLLWKTRESSLYFYLNRLMISEQIQARRTVLYCKVVWVNVLEYWLTKILDALVKLNGIDDFFGRRIRQYVFHFNLRGFWEHVILRWGLDREYSFIFYGGSPILNNCVKFSMLLWL